MRTFRWVALATGLVWLGAAPLSAAPFTWTGAVDTYWNKCGNWTYSGFPVGCYPQSGSDDVTIPYDGSPGATHWVITFANQTIDDLVLYEWVYFEADGGGNPCLTVDSITIDATDHSVDVEVEFDEVNVTNDCPT